ncbi:unnamed protein product, partial [Closterium sp. Naga37s-1]
ALQGIIHRARLLAALRPPVNLPSPSPTWPSALPLSSNPTATAALSSSSQLPMPDPNTASFSSLPLLALDTSHVGLFFQGLPDRSSSYLKHLPGSLPVQSSSHTDSLTRNISVQSSGHVDLSARNLPPQFSSHMDPFTRKLPPISSRTDLHTRIHLLQSTSEAGPFIGKFPAQSGHRDLFWGNLQSLSHTNLRTGSLPLQSSSHLKLSGISGSIPRIDVTPSACVDPARTYFFPEDELRKLLGAGPKLPSTLPQSLGEHMSRHKR